MAYLANTPDDRDVMLGAIGLDSVDELFEMVPEEFRLGRPLKVPDALSELDLTREVSDLIGQNLGADRRVCFLGGGCYDHFIPAVVDQLSGRGEFYTSYTPYQAEASQGTLQATFEYQSLIAQLTGMDLSNASLYDGGSAVAEAVLMAMSCTKRFGRVVTSTALHPEYRQILATYLSHLEPQIITVPAPSGRVGVDEFAAAINDETAAVVIQQPNFFGQIEDVSSLIAAAHRKGALAIVHVDPISLGLLRRPGDLGADIVVAEGQSLGNPMSFGGPYLGILACREAYVRKMPGRIVGQTTDRDGKRCWVLTLQTREQHIRREKATSNICTNQGLLALRSSIYLAVMGPSGLRRAAELSTRNAHHAAERLAAVPGVSLAFEGPFFKEFVIRTDKDPAKLLAEVGSLGYHGGIALGRWYPELADSILVAVTEKRTRGEIDGLARAYAEAVARV
jgi:glycine dehydrogenase subunit 1